MPREFLLDDGEGTGVKQFFVPNPDGVGFTLRTFQDVEPIIERNKALQTADDGYSPSRDMRRVASIPNNIILLWKKKYGIDVFDKNHAGAVRKLLNDPEWRYLRTAPGRL